MKNTTYAKLYSIVSHFKNHLLSPIDNRIISMYYEQDLSKEQISKLLNIQIENIDSSLKHSANVLYDYLNSNQR